MSIIRKIGSYLLLFFSLGLIVNLGKSIWRVWHADEIINKEKIKLERLKEEDQKLQGKLNHYQSEQFIEEQIRDKLQMAKPDETVVILPESLKQDSSDAALPNQANREELANWQKWLKLFW